jgi:hypothetical protein
MEIYFKTSEEFYDTDLSHLEAWNKLNEELIKFWAAFFWITIMWLQGKTDLLSPVSSSNRQLRRTFAKFTYLQGYLSQKRKWTVQFQDLL